MTEYIEREALLDLKEEMWQDRCDHMVVRVTNIMNVPAANVVEVVHAKWKPYTASNQFTHTCTNCHVDVNEKTPYCPYCGAIMSSWGRTMKFIKNGKLKDKEIETALREAADNYANGEIWEVKETLERIIDAIEEWAEYEEG